MSLTELSDYIARNPSNRSYILSSDRQYKADPLSPVTYSSTYDSMIISPDKTVIGFKEADNPGNYLYICNICHVSMLFNEENILTTIRIFCRNTDVYGDRVSFTILVQ